MRDVLGRFRVHLVALLFLSILAAAIVFYLRLPKPEGPVQIVLPPPSPTVDREIKVYVTGAVIKPGVYRMTANNRIEDALNAAGGPTGEANLDGVNLAAKVRDEMQINVPRLGEPYTVAGPSSASQRISISSATVDQLESLPGVGPVTAKRIIDHREKNGPFKNVEQLRDLKLVNVSTFEKIVDLIAP